MNNPTHSPEPNTSSVPAFDQDGVLVDRPAGVQCPSCQTELVIGEIESSQFAGCPSCHGMLFQQDVFAQLIQHLRVSATLPPMTPKPMDLDELQIRRSCPSCHSQLETHAYGGPGNAVIDTCFPCRVIWFDQGELTKLVRAPGKR